MEYIQQEKKKKSISQIVMECVEKIFEISTNEFHGGYYKTVVQGNVTSREYVPSPREEYNQAVRNLHHILKPFFDGEIKKRAKFIFKEIRKMRIEEIEKEEVNTCHRISQREVVWMERLFMELNFLLHRKDYLKGESYADEVEAEK